MKACVSAQGATLNDSVDPRFGRCSFFVFVDTDSLSFEVMRNDAGALGGGAGIQSAQVVAQKGAQIVLTGNCGPNAYQALRAAGIEVFLNCSGTISDVIAQFRMGQLKAHTGPG